jgi:hypothetical protein
MVVLVGHYEPDNSRRTKKCCPREVSPLQIQVDSARRRSESLPALQAPARPGADAMMDREQDRQRYARLCNGRLKGPSPMSYAEFAFLAVSVLKGAP